MGLSVADLTTRTRPIPRGELASALGGNHRLVKIVESIQEDVGSTLPDGVNEAQDTADTATSVAAAAANAAAEAISDAAAAQATADGVALDLAAHEAAADPHPQYLRQVEADALYDAIGAASSAVTAHEAAVDPHPQYQTQAEGDARYPLLSSQPGAATLSNATGTGETVIAQWALSAGFLAAGRNLRLSAFGQVSSTATLTYRLRIGTAGTTADALVATFATTGAGTANDWTTVEMLIACLTAGASGTATAAGRATLASALVGIATAAYSAATIDTTAALKVSLTVQQSSAQTHTTRAAMLS